MKKKNIPSFLCGALFMLMLVGLILPASAASNDERVVSVFTNVKVFVNDQPIDAGDLNGNPEAFIYNGTTYIPVRAVSNSLGQDVKWDGETRSVYVGKHAGSTSYLLDVCPPYEKYYYEAPDYFKMMGQTFYHGFKLCGCGGGTPGYAYFTLNGKYESLEFDFGHIDDAAMNGSSFAIYLDGEFVQAIEGTPDMLVQHIVVPLNHALQMKVVCTKGGFSWPYYGFGNVEIH